MKNTLLILIMACSLQGFTQSPGNNLPATDALGRKLPTAQEVGGPKKDKFVGLFYWTWHTEQAKNNPPLNTTQYLARDPKAREDYDNPIWPKTKGPWFWGEPLFGYYVDTDQWVLRKHAEMLADAGIDVIIFDCTNGNFTWKESYIALCKAYTHARADGVKTPQIAFMLPFGNTPGGKEIIHELYTDMYKSGLYKDLWFIWKGKPLIMAYPETVEGADGIDKEIKNFFTFRPAQPVYNKGPERQDHWGWLEIYPQHGFVKSANGSFEQATVSVAQNWSAERGLTAMNAKGSFGRSYHAKGDQDIGPNAVDAGYNFQEQWERALEINPEFIFITGWNEWIAGRYKKWGKQTNAFPDEFNQEGSRDIEPMKGGHGDNYYYQMINNIRRFKGMPATEPASGPLSVNIDGDFKEWDKVKPTFTSYKGNTLHRNSAGWGSLIYTNNTGRNDIVLAKVARDKKFVYFYAETANPLSPNTDPAWMQLFIDADRNKNTGWEGYDLVINRVTPGQKAVLERTEAGWGWKQIAEVDYAVKRNKLEIKVPRALISQDDKLDFEFKWSDNMQQPNDIMDFWINGDVAPAGRFNFNYKSSQ